MSYDPRTTIPNVVQFACVQSFPERPVIDPATTAWTREELEGHIDWWMDYLRKVTTL